VLTALLDAAASWPVPVVLAVSGALLVVESGTLFGVVLPGTTMLVALGLWSLTAPHALAFAVVAAAAATVAGAHVGWLRGRAGAPFGRARGRFGRLAETRAQHAGTWLTERGRPATATLIACGHWAAAARPLLPRLAGAAGVPYRTVGPVLMVSGSGWAATLVLLGNRVGALVVTTAAWVPILVVALLVAALLLRSHAARRRAGPASVPDRAPLIAPSRPFADPG
jgi:membrane-associated protein